MSIDSISCDDIEILSAGELPEENEGPAFEKSIFSPRSGLSQMRRSAKLAPLSSRELRIQQEVGRALDVNTSVEAKVDVEWDTKGQIKWSAGAGARVKDDRGNTAGIRFEQSTDGSGKVTIDTKHDETFDWNK